MRRGTLWAWILSAPLALVACQPKTPPADVETREAAAGEAAIADEPAAAGRDEIEEEPAARTVSSDATTPPVDTAPVETTSRANADGASPEPSGALPTVDRLIEHIETRNGPAMYADLERCLLAGEEGFATLFAFIDRADTEVHQRIRDLTHEPQLLYALLRLTAKHPDEIARLSIYLCDASRDRPESYIRRELFNFVPVFLAHHPGRYAELRERLLRAIDRQLELKGQWLGKLFFAVRDLDHSPPIDLLVAILRDQSVAASHPMVVQHLAARGPEGLTALDRYVRDPGERHFPTISLAVRLIVNAAARSGDRALLDPLLQSAPADLRATTVIAYFDFRRRADDTHLVLTVLNDPINPRTKEALARLISRKSPEVLQALVDQIELIDDEPLRVFIRKLAARKLGTPPPADSSADDDRAPTDEDGPEGRPDSSGAETKDDAEEGGR